MQRGDEDSALDRKLECTVFQQLLEHGGDAEPVPIRPNSKGPPMRLAATDTSVLVQRADEQDLVSELGPGSQQRSERAGGDQIRRSGLARPDVLVRASWRQARWLDESGRPLDLLAALKKAGQPGRVDQPIWLGRKSGPPILLRLVALRKPPAAAAEARRKAHRYAQRDPPRRRKLQAMPSIPCLNLAPTRACGDASRHGYFQRNVVSADGASAVRLGLNGDFVTVAMALAARSTTATRRITARAPEARPRPTPWPRPLLARIVSRNGSPDERSRGRD